MPSENQHWVPKFLVKEFADADGRVFCLDIRTDEITKPPPKYAAAGVAFNEFTFDGHPFSFEEKLAKIETRAAPIMRRIVKSESLVWLSTEQKNLIADFVAAQSFRTEAFYKGLDSLLSREEFGTVFMELWRSAFLLSAEIARR